MERAASGPFGTIAHGYLTLSMIPTFLQETYSLREVAAVLNYGLEAVRFPHPLRVGAKVRGVVSLETAETTRIGLRAALGVTVEIKGTAKPACVARVIHVLVAS